MFSQKEQFSLPRNVKSHKESHALSSALCILPVPWDAVSVRVKGMLETSHWHAHHPYYKIAFCISPRKKKGELQRVLSPGIHAAEVWVVRSRDPTLNLWGLITSLCYFHLLHRPYCDSSFSHEGPDTRRLLNGEDNVFSKMDLIETKWYYERLIIPDTYVLNKYHLLSWVYWPNLYCDFTTSQLLL